jgi:membrane protease YdiL (CAAX protease family)
VQNIEAWSINIWNVSLLSLEHSRSRGAALCLVPMRLSPPALPHSSRPIAFAIFLVVYGNAKSALLGDAPAGGLPGVGIGLLLICSTAFRAYRTPGLGREDVGITRANAKKSALVGLTASIAISGSTLLLGRLVSPRRIAEGLPDSMRRLSASDAAKRVVFFLPLDTVFPEEFAFRGLLQAELQRHLPVAVACIINAGAFALWHVVLTLKETPRYHRPATIASKLAVDFLGGVLFSLLRGKTSNLVGSVIAHWVFDAVLMFGAIRLARDEALRKTVFGPDSMPGG